jgi:Pyruvate/2-oxoacid:ferredoxin oxidoreductase delta subunit
MADTINNLNLNEMDLEVKETEKKKSDTGIFGKCEATLIPRYGVIHVKNAFTDEGQQQIWNLLKPRIHDPSNKACGFHCFNICHKDHINRKPEKRFKEVDYYAKLLFERTAEEFMKLNFDASNEPCYQRLQNLANGSKPFKPGQQYANYYRADAGMENHLDSEQILFSMSLSIGDDCEFHIGKPTKRSGTNKRMSERSGKVEKIIIKSGDAVFFNGGSCPHHVVRMVKGTAPSWWNKMKVSNGSRLAIIMREQEESFLKALISKAEKKKTQQKKTRVQNE